MKHDIFRALFQRRLPYYRRRHIVLFHRIRLRALIGTERWWVEAARWRGGKSRVWALWRSLNESEENGGHEEKKEKTRRRKQGAGSGPWNGWDWARVSARERWTEVAEVELMHAPGHAPKPLTGSQPTSLYDKYKRRAQRLLLIAWQKLRNPHFVLRTPDSLTGEPPPATLSFSLSLSLSLSLSFSFFFSSSHPSRLSPRSWKEWRAVVVVVVVVVYGSSDTKAALLLDNLLHLRPK